MLDMAYLGWFDDDKKMKVEQKIADAADRYMEKFGSIPTECLVNEIDAVVEVVDGIAIKVVPYVRPNHFWIGVPEKEVSYGL